MNFVEHFWERVAKGTTDSCWQWIGHVNWHGYGDCTMHSKSRTAHRVAWELVNGDIPKGLHVLHRCDNRLCVNPNHLFLGTHQENMADMKRKGRGRTSPKAGELHPQAKLTANDVREIRQLLSARPAPMPLKRTVARRFGVSPHTVENIIYRHSWKHLDA